MSKPGWLDKEEGSRKFSQRRERGLAKKFGAKLTPNSGARWHSKGDMTTAEELVEVKSTAKPSMVLHKQWFVKVREEAIKAGKSPVFIVDFGDIILVGRVELTNRGGK